MEWSFFAPMVIMVSLIGMTGWICLIFIRARQRRRELEALSAFQTRLLDKLDSGEELRRFMESSGGERLLKSFQQPPARGLDRVLSAATAGLVMTALGFAAIIVQESCDLGGFGFRAIGTLLLGLGVGFVLSAGLSFVLARHYGALDGGSAGPASGTP
jgi:hypothetical protein